MSHPGGHVRPEIYFYMPEYIKKYGLEMAAAISNFEISHVQALKDLVEKEQIDCDFTLGRSMDVFLDEAQAVEAKAAYDELKESGLVSLKDVQYTSAKCAEIVSAQFLRIVPDSFPLGNLTYFRFLAFEARKDALVSQLPIFGHTNSSCTSSPLLLRAASTYKLQHRYHQWPPRLIRPMGNGSLQPQEVQSKLLKSFLPLTGTLPESLPNMPGKSCPAVASVLELPGPTAAPCHTFRTLM